ncbi:MAG: PAS domain S-box protein, partial [Alphaproteobacteria bacterium]|nr:PAS domain S-box protein [Alphaproteobacteria bacterium]
MGTAREPIIDESLREQKDAALGAAELAALLDAAVDGIIVTDEDGTILRVNKASEQMFGFSADEMVGEPVTLIMTEADAGVHFRYIKNYMDTGVRKIIGIGRDVMARDRSGRKFPVAVSIGEVKLGEQRRFVGLIRDLTRQRQAEEEALRHREQMMHVSRLTTMGEMAAAMAHELNQPLSAIATYTAACVRLLDKGDETQDDVVSALQEIGTQAYRAGEVIERMRDFTRGRELDRTVVPVGEIIDEILPLAELDARANRVQLTVDVAPDMPRIVADPVQIQQVILNLLRNGVDAMADTPEDGRQLRLTAFRDSDDSIRVDIGDRGHGVSDESQARLFTPFFTTKKAGMGMGLAIS